MKIALVAQHTVPRSGHTEDDIRLRNLSRGLAADSHDVTVYAQRSDGQSPCHAELCPGVSVEYIGPAEAVRDDAGMLLGLSGFTGPLRERLGADRPDVVHALRWTSGLAALAATQDLRVPVVQSFSSLCVAERRHHLLPPGAGIKRMRLEPAIARSASAVLADNSEGESELARAGVPRRTITVVPCGVDTSAFTPEGPVADRGGRSRLITVTGPDSHDEIATLLHALSRMPDAELMIVGGPPAGALGDDPVHRKLSELAETLGVADRVEFTGDVPRTTLPDLLRSADLMVSVSQYDPAGMTILESMACGTPVVATTAGDDVDAIADGMTGILVPPRRPVLLAERIRQLLAHPMRLAAFGAAAADRARSRYSWDRIVRETAAVYDRATDAAA